MLAYGIFHGDLHAGNVLVDDDQGFSLVDFGICGRVDAVQRRALVRLTVAYAQRDAAGQVRALRDFGACPPTPTSTCWRRRSRRRPTSCTPGWR